MCSLWSNHCAQCGASSVLTVGQSMGSLWGNQCAQCGATDVLTVEQPMCSVWSSQRAHCGAINVLTVELHVSMCSLWSNQCVHCVGQTNCTVWGNQCAYYGAANVLTVEQPMCSLWSNQCAHCVAINMHPDLFSIHTTVRQPNQSISNQLDLVVACSKQKSVVHFQRSYVGCCQGCNSAECYEDGTQTFTCYFQVALRLT
jgi:hypothetical protein